MRKDPSKLSLQEKMFITAGWLDVEEVPPVPTSEPAPLRYEGRRAYARLDSPIELIPDYPTDREEVIKLIAYTPPYRQREIMGELVKLMNLIWPLDARDMFRIAAVHATMLCKAYMPPIPDWDPDLRLFDENRIYCDLAEAKLRISLGTQLWLVLPDAEGHPPDEPEKYMVENIRSPSGRMDIIDVQVAYFGKDIIQVPADEAKFIRRLTITEKSYARYINR